METTWYFRLFFVNISWFVISWLLFGIIRAKRMSGPGPSKAWMIAFWTALMVGWILTWFVTFSINLAFWIGVAIIVFGEVVFALGYIAMREHPEKKKTVVDWGIYKVERDMNKKFNKNNKLIGEKNITYTSFSNRFMEHLDFSANSNGIHNPATHFGNYRETHVS